MMTFSEIIFFVDDFVVNLLIFLCCFCEFVDFFFGEIIDFLRIHS